jgi:hypothetical protein
MNPTWEEKQRSLIFAITIFAITIFAITMSANEGSGNGRPTQVGFCLPSSLQLRTRSDYYYIKEVHSEWFYPWTAVHTEGLPGNKCSN